MFRRTSLIFVSAVLVLVVGISAKKLPSYIIKCKKDNSNKAECLKGAITSLKPKLAKGIPELYVPPCDPLLIPSVELSQPNGGSLSFSANLKDLTFTGGTNFDVLKANFDLQKGFVEISMNFFKMIMKGDYKAKGKFLIVEFEGQGKIDAEFDNIIYKGVWELERIIKKEKEYLKVTKHKSSVNVQDLRVDFENLISGNPELSKQLSGTLSEDRLLFNETKPAIESVLSGVVSQVVNNVLDHYSYNDLFDD